MPLTSSKRKIALSLFERMRPLVTFNPYGLVTLPQRMIWTSSSVKLFRSCKRKWFWKYIMRLRMRYSSKDLMIGKAFHSSLGEWYTSRRSSMQLIAARVAATLRAQAASSVQYFTSQEDVDKLAVLVDTFEGMVVGYAENYAEDRRKWKIDRRGIERIFVVDMGDFDYSGRIDLVAQHPGDRTYFVVEHKTAARIPESYVERLPLDTQVRGYVFGAKKDPRLAFPIDRVVYDVVRKCLLRRKTNESLDGFGRRIAEDYLDRNHHYFLREELLIDKHDLAAFEWEIRQVHAEYRTLTEMFRDKEFLVKEMGVSDDLIKHHDPLNPRTWNPNDQHCNAYFRLCEYFTLCRDGLDKGTAQMFELGEDLNEELVEEE